ncbi:YheT family hydrolase [Alloalcanivorax gelatiniphagus]|uniref:Alpha/beta fold hydrolase n=1 Tax=Alloalcanivorax gelatiniphagus TaxID=1194167 RepID=A0ABY2XGL7_9GAMM|nr:alpha/beta fold hydrolase [Alloalcanivorax gelatiniphagus]TMW10808.1 alpha/beta fold hydrolase [Alloalcanivorax gelatiniphagus]
MAEIVEAPFRAPPWLRSPHLQTLWGPLVRRADHLSRRRETLTLDDGDHLLLDRAGPEPQAGDLRVVLLHGLSGCSDSHYIRGTQARLAAAGIASVAINSRGAAAPNDTALSYHAGETDDLDAVFRHLRAEDRHGPLLAIGVSLGGSRLLNWLARRDSGTLSAAVSVCTPLNLAVCADRMDRGLSRLYRRHLIKALLDNLQRQHRHLQKVAPDQARRLAALNLKGIRSFWQFDDQVIAPLYGFRDAAHYYAECSAGSRLAAIRTPTLMIQAEDDPFMTTAVLPAREDLGPGVTLELSPQGGHVGFITGSPRHPDYWLERRLTAFAAGLTGGRVTTGATPAAG